MKKLQTLIGSSLILAASGPALAGSYLDSMMKDMNPYLGVDGQVRQMRWQENLGKDHLRNVLWQHNYFAGMRFNDYWGLEMGYQHTFNNFKNINIKVNEMFLNADYGNTVAAEFKVKSKVRGFNFNLKGYWPLWTKGGCQYDAYALLGASRLTIAAEQMQLTDIGTGAPRTAQQITDSHQHYKANSWASRVGLGMQVTMKEHYGLRAGLHWEGTSSFTLEEKPLTGLEQMAKPKRSWIGSVGLFYKF